jgi:antitoxin component YwqK of YwqJK toxin-antitoxin module
MNSTVKNKFCGIDLYHCNNGAMLDLYKVHFFNGKIHGTYIGYHTDELTGKEVPRLVAFYKNDKLCGPVISFTPSGRLKSFHIYDEGRLIASNYGIES